MIDLHKPQRIKMNKIICTFFCIIKRRIYDYKYINCILKINPIIYKKKNSPEIFFCIEVRDLCKILSIFCFCFG